MKFEIRLLRESEYYEKMLSSMQVLVVVQNLWRPKVNCIIFFQNCQSSFASLRVDVPLKGSLLKHTKDLLCLQPPNSLTNKIPATLRSQRRIPSFKLFLAQNPHAFLIGLSFTGLTTILLQKFGQETSNLYLTAPAQTPVVPIFVPQLGILATPTVHKLLSHDENILPDSLFLKKKKKDQQNHLFCLAA